MIKKIFLALVFFTMALGWAGFVSANFASASEEPVVISFFYSKTCPHCGAEQNFLDKLEQKYPEVQINRYLYDDPKNQELLRELCQKCNSERYIGLVPLTFVNLQFFLGFDDENGAGKKIEQALKNELAGQKQAKSSKISLPWLGEISGGKYSLLFVAVLLGAFDGFNVCSLGALVLILGLVLALRSRLKILVFGSVFILTTGLVYGFLIILWYKIFSYFVSFLWLMKFLIGFLGLGGGVYFLTQFLKFRKKGPVCEKKEKGLVLKLSLKLQNFLKEPKHILLMAGAILIFAAVVAVVEFPCSALVPVTYAGLLAQSGLSTFQYLLHIALYILFYMLDEIIVFLVAVLTMNLWLTSPKFTLWATLAEALVLFALGGYYLFAFVM